MLKLKTTNPISEEEYLQGELLSAVKHELVDGYIYAMAGASVNRPGFIGGSNL
jgi:Uma2 family endonuclease